MSSGIIVNPAPCGIEVRRNRHHLLFPHRQWIEIVPSQLIGHFIAKTPISIHETLHKSLRKVPLPSERRIIILQTYFAVDFKSLQNSNLAYQIDWLEYVIGDQSFTEAMEIQRSILLN